MTDSDLRFADDFAEASLEAWRAAVDKVLKGGDFERRLVSRTEDGIRIEPLYTKGADDPTPGVPGAAPFVRGTRTHARWLIEQRHAHPDPATANRQALDDLARGVEGLRLVTADPLSPAPEGIALAEPSELEAVLDGVFTEMAPVSLEAGSRGVPMARALLQLWADRGDPDPSVAGDLHVDPLATLLRTGRLPGGTDAALAEAKALVDEVHGRLPHVRSLGIDLRLPHEAGASAGQELAIGLAQLAFLLRGFEAQGLDPATVTAQTTWLVAVDDDVFQSIAKLRALRRTWSTLIGACGLEVPAPRLVAETSRRMLAQRDPWVNLLRNTVAAFAGGVGGADAVTVLPYTAALGLPDRSARRMARNTQLILLEEAALDHVVDPAGGSFYVEHLTDELAKLAWQRFQDIEAAGGFLAALDSGKLLDDIAAVAKTRAKAIATRKAPLTGVTTFPQLDERAVELDRCDAAPRYARIQAPEPSTADRTTEPWPRLRLAEPFERLRDAADQATQAKGARPSVLLLNLGTLAEHNVRTSWIKGLIAAGGLATHDSEPLADAAAVTAACKAKPATIAVLCSSDARYAELAAPAAKAAKAAGISHLYLAGRPGEHEATWRAAGVDGFLYQGLDVLAELDTLHARLIREN
ncbi:MAG: methylmalonyl-CoA mutase [Geminicoccaceae bacterium]|nr:MAG: methylmalonyl-CoA mutase [Geminicoccaceae bacterium]